MSTIVDVDILDPMLGTVVAAEGPGVLERLPLPVNKAPHQVILNFLEDPMRRHDLCDGVCILGAVHEETEPSQFLYKPFRHPQ